MARKKAKVYTVSTNVFGVSLREAPGGKVLDKIIPNGETVAEISQQDGWIEVDGGWIRKEFLK